MSGETRQPLQGAVGWSYDLSGWVIEVVDPASREQLAVTIVTMSALPPALQPARGQDLVSRNGLVVSRVGNYGQSVYEALAALCGAELTYQGRSISWAHDPHLQRKL